MIKAGEITNKERLEEELGRKISRVFQIEKVGRLVRRTQGKKRGRVSFETEFFNLDFSFSTGSKNVSITHGVKIKEFLQLQGKVIFIPPKEVLSTVKGLVQVYKEREFEIEETYPDLADLLQLPVKKRISMDKNLSALFQKLGIKQVRLEKDGHFYIKLEEPKQGRVADLEAPLVAEGFRKLATLFILVKNGSLSKGSTLFWDEPEVNMNPSVTADIVELLKILSSIGIQIFVATHDYFFIKYADLKLKNKKFFSLFWDEDRVELESTNSIYALEHNDIIDEFEKIYITEFGGKQYEL